MERSILGYLKQWLSDTDRKPLVLRGARQVGKTWIIRHLAAISGKNLIEINFEKQPNYTDFFTPNNPQEILLNLSTIFNQEITAENNMLFLDEIQNAPEVLSKLRWFAEDLPQLPVIAAGSLLDFVIADHQFSMPVGRISYLHLEPLSFEEFLLASDKRSLYDYLLNYELTHPLSKIIQELLTTLFKEYLLIGGLPAAVHSWCTHRSFAKVSQIQNDLLSTYRDDFAKYRSRISLNRLDEVMLSIPKMLGQKFVYTHVNKMIQANTIKQILELLEKARIVSRVKGTSANGIPLGAEVKENYFKEIFLDVGLCSIALGLNLNQLNPVKEVTLINQGGLAEQVVGQLLRTITPPFIEPALYCWHRNEAGSSSEIDYVIQQGSQIIPIEVKAGSTGSLKSLHLFMGAKKLPLALRINSDIPSKVSVKVKVNPEALVTYDLISLPFYMIGQIPRLLDNFLQPLTPC